MRSEWITSTIDDICKLVTDGAHNSPKSVDNGYYMASVKDFTAYGFDFSNCRKISEADYLKLKKQGCVPESGDILVGKDGARYFEDVIIYRQKEQPALLSSIAILRVDDTKVTSEFLYYTLKSPAVKKDVRDNYGSGSAIPRIVLKDFKRMPISFPSLKEQKKITNICVLLDEKIQLNNRINKNLEQQAQALFKSWFLDYEPWDGSAPNSWKSGKLGDFAKIKRGGSPRPIQEYLSDSGLRWLKISDVTSLQTPFVIDIKDHIIEAGLRKTVFLKAGSLVLSNSATPGVPKILDVDSCIHDGWLYFPESKFSKEYLYLYFKYIRQQLVNLSNGSVFNNLKTDILKGYPTILPDKDTLRRFDDIVMPMFLQMRNLNRESHKLVDMRNALLPKLMSGEIDVSKLDL